MNTGCSASEYACCTSALMAAGSFFSNAGSAAALATWSPGGSGDASQRRDQLAGQALEKIAPNTETPNAPPILRKKVTPEVAVPRSA